MKTETRAAQWTAVIPLLFLFCLTAHAADCIVTVAAPITPPFSGQGLKNKGYGAQIVISAFARAGYEARVEIYPWQRCLEMCRKGLVQGVMPVWKTPERTAAFDLSAPIPLPYIMGVCHKEGLALEKDRPLSLSPFRVGYVFGYAYPDIFHKITAGALMDRSYSTVEMMEKLVKNLIDIAIVGERQGDFFLKTHWPGHKKRFLFIRPSIAVIPRYIGFAKNIENKSLIRDFNRGLEMIRADGTIDRILDSHGLKGE